MLRNKALLTLTILGMLLAACSSNNGSGSPTQYSAATGFPITGPTSTANTIGVLITANNPVLGDIITDSKGMTLYISTQDSPGISNCDTQCAAMWPPYTIQAGNSLLSDPTVHGKLGNTQRSDGTYQLTIQNRPLYYYSGDQKPGDVNGQGKGGMWYVLDPSAQPIKTPATTPAP